ncbi:Argininosuccinate lyase [Achromobacter denitrificans]|jgi:tripartite-type tricarboxylate transporter receptor subunit TctC|uniref:Tripartite tricarboxylate transporter substrate binding protein n=1 Tax=Achromobacter denitrificans TaxID=32002 RepID=A0ABZ3G3J1_ACHDE|nr:tripartite tricarboxylate transporter substrate binding protein [Achromobacter denitrificans]ASC63318.1 tripartite tricarboxylate transporter substrate binding protein [Achromobacter denitrificans]OLU09671.1 LacI family transcriptional regulator [Achromobacter denitrificans]QKH45529.1 tripartite tricarboxylate transporter substrate binding protein [Achromobacter denitrificans]QKH53129.1 tripartite tricarboxylate transporter substrate binding protein [Achromobacter denitrificans]CAB3659353.1
MNTPCTPARPMTRMLGAIGLALALSGGPAAVMAQDFPSKPLRMVVGFAPGGGADIVARLVGAKMAENLGQQVVVENRAGATGTIAADNVARSPADGYSLFLGSQSTMVVAPSLFPSLPFKPEKDFAPVSQVVTMPLILVVNPALVDAKTVQELTDHIRKAGDGAVSYASSGQGGPQHIAGELYAHMVGTKVTHVPYKGESAAMADVLGGHVPYMFANLPVALPHISSGKVRPLAITSLKRDPKAPQIPTLAESGFKDFEVSTWYGVFAPANTPKPVVDKLSKSIQTVLEQSEMQAKLSEQGFTVVGSDAAAFSGYVASELPRWSVVIRDIGIKPE